MGEDRTTSLFNFFMCSGYRYELYCSAKAQKTPHCVVSLAFSQKLKEYVLLVGTNANYIKIITIKVYCESSKENCIQWNSNREDKYSEELYVYYSYAALLFLRIQKKKS